MVPFYLQMTGARFTFKWIVPDGATPITGVVENAIEKNLISLRNIFRRFRMVLAKHVATETFTSECISLVIYAMKNLNTLLQPPRKVWQYLFQVKDNIHGTTFSCWFNYFFVAHIQMHLLSASSVK